MIFLRYPSILWVWLLGNLGSVPHLLLAVPACLSPSCSSQNILSCYTSMQPSGMKTTIRVSTRWDTELLAISAPQAPGQGLAYDNGLVLDFSSILSLLLALSFSWGVSSLRAEIAYDSSSPHPPFCLSMSRSPFSPTLGSTEVQRYEWFNCTASTST